MNSIIKNIDSEICKTLIVNKKIELYFPKFIF